MTVDARTRVNKQGNGRVDVYVDGVKVCDLVISPDRKVVTFAMEGELRSGKMANKMAGPDWGRFRFEAV